MANEARQQDEGRIRHDLARLLQLLETSVDRRHIQPRLKGDLAAGDFQDAQVVGVRAGKQVQVKELFPSLQLFHERVVPEGHPYGAIFSHSVPSPSSYFPPGAHAPVRP